MYLSLKGSLGHTAITDRVGESLLQIAEGSSAAYSLRNLGSDSPSVVRVRRESDNAERDFTAQDINTSVVENWVNTDVDKLDLQTGSLDPFITNETATGFDFSVNNEGANKFKNLLPTAATVAGTYVTTLDVSLNSGSLTGCNLYHTSAGQGIITPLTAGANLLSLTPDANTNIFFYILGTAVADVSITNITLTQTSADGHVSTWYDQSTTAGVPNANHATQGTAASQPKIVDAGALVLSNGNAAIKSTSNNSMNFTLDSLSADGQQSVFSVLENDVTSQDNFGPVFRVSSTSTSTGGVDRRPYWFVTPTAGEITFSVDSLAGYKNSDRERRLYSHIMNDDAGGTSTVYQDGTQVDTRSITLDANANFSSAEIVSVTTNATGALYMSEVIYYPSDESANRLAVENNIDNHYGITSAGSYVNAAGDSYINAAGDTYLQP